MSRRTATRNTTAQQLSLLPEQEQEAIEPTKHGWDTALQQYQEALKIIERFPDLKRAIEDGRTSAKEIRARDRVIQEQANTIALLTRKLEDARQGTEAERLEQEVEELRAKLRAVCAEKLRKDDF